PGARFVLVNRAFARRFWPANGPGGVDAIGRRGRFDDQEWRAIAGGGGGIRETERNRAGEPGGVISFTQRHRPFLVQSVSLVVRTKGADAALASIRREVAALDRGQPIFNVKTMEEVMDASVAERRVTLGLLGGFALLALILASLGIFGVISYSV